MCLSLRAKCAATVRARVGSVRDAFSAAPVRRGMLGTTFITLGALSPAYLPRSSPWWNLATQLGSSGDVARVLGTAITMVGLFLLVDGWLRLQPRPGNPEQEAYHDLRHWAILLLWGLPFLFAPPIFSHDAYSYAAQGWLVHNGINPYEAGPSVLPGRFADQVSWVWRDTPAPYGPLSLQLQHLIVDIMGHRPYMSAVAMRSLSIVGVIVIGLLVPRVARQRGADPAVAAWFATLNPVLVIDFIGGAHNDSLMVAFIVAALWVTGWDASRWRFNPWWLLGAVLVGVGATIKQPALLTAYILPLMVRPWTSWQPREVGIHVARVLTSIGVAIGAFALVSVLTGLGFGWINAVNVPGQVVTIAPFTLIGQGIQLIVNALSLDPTGWAAVRTTRTVGVILAGVVVAVGAVTVARTKPLKFLSTAYLIVALALPAVRGWYLLWGGTLLPLGHSSLKTLRIATWITVIMLCYNGVNMAWRNNLMAVGFAAAVGIGMFAWWRIRRAWHARHAHVSRDT